MLNVKLDIFIQDTTTFLTKKKKKITYLWEKKERRKKRQTLFLTSKLEGYSGGYFQHH